MISDGHDNTSHVDRYKLESELIQHGIRVFATNFQWVGTLTPVQGENHLQDIVFWTGGTWAVVSPGWDHREGSYDEALRDSAGKPTRRGTEIDMQARTIVNDSKMVVELPGPADKQRNWALRLSDPKLSKDAILIYPRRLPACSVSTSH